MLSVGGLTLCPIHYRAAFASSLIPSPAVSLASFAGSLPSQGDSGVTSFTFSIDPGVRSCLSAGGATSTTGELGAPAPDHVPFWFKPDSIFGLFLERVMNCSAEKHRDFAASGPRRGDFGPPSCQKLREIRDYSS